MILAAIVFWLICSGAGYEIWWRDEYSKMPPEQKKKCDEDGMGFVVLVLGPIFLLLLLGAWIVDVLSSTSKKADD